MTILAFQYCVHRRTVSVLSLDVKNKEIIILLGQANLHTDVGIDANVGLFANSESSGDKEQRTSWNMIILYRDYRELVILMAGVHFIVV